MLENSIIAILMVIFSSFTGSIGSYFFKLGSEKFSFKTNELIKNYKIIIGFILFGCSSFIYIYALRISKLTILYPLSSLSYVWTLFIGNFFLQEKITILKSLGIALIFGGAIIIVFSI